MSWCRSFDNCAYKPVGAISFYWPLIFSRVSLPRAFFLLELLHSPSLSVSLNSWPRVVVCHIVPQIATSNGVFDSVSQLVIVVCVMAIVAVKLAIFASFSTPGVRLHSWRCWQFVGVSIVVDFHQDFSLQPPQ